MSSRPRVTWISTEKANEEKRPHTEGLTDEEIIARFRQTGEKNWVGMLYKRYAHLVLGLCFKYMKNKQKAEDMTSEIFVSLFDDFRKHELKNFRGWLYTKSRNQCLMALRKADLKTTELLNGHDADTGLSALEFKELQEQQFERLEAAIEELKEGQRTCISLFYIHSLSYNEVAQQSGLSIKAVKSNIQNGKRNLKIILEQHSEFHGR